MSLAVLVVDTGESADSIQKHTADNMKLKSSKTKKHKTLPNIESDIFYNQEKGFPGVQVALNQEIIPGRNHMLVLHDKECLIFASSKEMSSMNVYLHSENHNMPLLSNYSSSYRQLLSESQLENSCSGWPWDAMKKYAGELPSVSDNENGSVILSSELFRKAFCVIHQGGERGVTLSELSQALHPLGMQFVYLVVDILKRFQLAIKLFTSPLAIDWFHSIASQVNAYDSVQIVDSLHMSKYHITTLAECNHSCCSGAPDSQIVDTGDPKNLPKEKHAMVNDLPGPVKLPGDGQTIRLSNVQSKLSSPHIYSKSLGDEESSSTPREDNKESDLYYACDMPSINLYCHG